MAAIAKIRRTVSDLTVPKAPDLESPPTAEIEDLVGWPFGTEEFLGRVKATSSSSVESPQITPRLRQKFFSGPLHYRNGVTASPAARSESTLSPGWQANASLGGSLESSPLSEVAENEDGVRRSVDKDFSLSPLSTGSPGAGSVVMGATDRVMENGEVAVTSSSVSPGRSGATNSNANSKSLEPCDPNTADSQSSPLAGSSSERESPFAFGREFPVGISAGVTLQGHGLRRPAGMLPPVPMKLRPSMQQKKRPTDPGLQKLHHIINRATMELDENAEFAEVFAKTLAEATAIIQESPRPFSQEQMDTQRYGLPVVLERGERGDDSEDSLSLSLSHSQVGRSPIGQIPPSDYSMGSVGRDEEEGREEEERSVFTLSEIEGGREGGGEGGWLEEKPSLSTWKVVLLSFMAGSTGVMLLMGIVVEACTSAGVIYSASFQQEFFFFLVLSSLVTLQALFSGCHNQLTAHSNALMVAWILDAALVSELLTALISQRKKHPHTVAARSPFICLTLVNLLLVSVLLLTSFKWRRLAEREAQQTHKSKGWREWFGRRKGTSFSSTTKKRAWEASGTELDRV